MTPALLLLTVLAASPVRQAAGEAPAPRPNIVLVLADDLGYGDVSCYGATHLETPSIDRLAARGVRFLDGYVASSECAPSRAGLLTGRYPQRCRFRTNADARLGLPPGEVTLGDALQEAGYATAVIGKWHLGMKGPAHPVRRGFDEFYGFLAGGHPYRALKVDDLPGNPIYRGEEPIDDEGYLTDRLTEEAVAFVERQAEAETPFFLYLSYSAPHVPLQAPDGWPELPGASPEEREAHLYRGLVKGLDDGVGRVLDTLERLELDEDTLVVFLSDNGGTENSPSRNGPFRGGKRDLWEGGLRVPFVVAFPDRFPAGEVCDEPVLSLDVFPTCLALAGVPWGDDRPALDGRSLVPLLEGRLDGPLHSELHWMNHDEWAVRRGKWKLVVRDRRDRQLTDLSEDPAEQQDLHIENRGEFRRLERLHDEWEATLPPRLYRPGRDGR